jgi:hypothetical protein
LLPWYTTTFIGVHDSTSRCSTHDDDARVRVTAKATIVTYPS